MKFIRFKKAGEERLGVLSKDDTLAIELSSLNLSKSFTNIVDLINNISDCDMDIIQNIISGNSVDSLVTYSLDKIKLCSPIKKPIHDIICVGVNYREHLEETKESFGEEGFKESKKAVYFSKRATEIIGPEDTIIGHANIDDQLDYEVELAVIIGRGGTNIPKEKVEDYIFGYTIMNDVSARGLQQQHLQWYRGKSLDTFTALGPVIVSKEEMPFPIEVNLTSKVNGELRQSNNTKSFLTDIPSIIAEISSGMTLEAGDIIATGTPSGVGMGFNPPRFMKAGDVVECEVENIGILRNYVK